MADRRHVSIIALTFWRLGSRSFYRPLAFVPPLQETDHVAVYDKITPSRFTKLLTMELLANQNNQHKPGTFPENIVDGSLGLHPRRRRPRCCVRNTSQYTMTYICSNSGRKAV